MDQEYSDSADGCSDRCDQTQVLKQQGFSTFQADERIRQGQLPAQEIIEGMLLAAAGAMLLTPGFLTDTLGFLCLAGPVRRPLANRLVAAGFVRAAGFGHFRVARAQPGPMMYSVTGFSPRSGIRR